MPVSQSSATINCEQPLVHPKVGHVRFDFFRSLWFWGMLTIGLVFGIPNASWKLTGIAAILTLLTLCLGHSVGLHRGIIHETYSMPPLLRGILAYLAVLTGMGGPLTWITIHGVRDYWQNQKDCPRFFAYQHSYLRDIWWNLHHRYASYDRREEVRLPKGIYQDRWLVFLEKTWPLHNLGLAVVFWLTLGPEAVAICICARIGLGILGHQAVGYASHAFGHQPYPIEGAHESGTNHWFLGVVSFGEGFHNYHHAFPESARMGLGRYDFDLGWYMICAMEKLNLIWSVKTPKSHESKNHKHDPVSNCVKTGLRIKLI